MIEQVLMPGGDPHRIGEFIAEEYIQHNPDVADGLAIFRLDKGLIVEHWDNVEAIGPEEEWGNSEKF